MNQLKVALDQRLEEHLMDDSPHIQTLFDSARYTVFAPSKRLRPLLLLGILDAYGIPIEKGLDAACALEMIHTYSLIHDDLPCMDDDEIRRGQPSLHTITSDGHAVLTGDYLLTKAFDVLSHASGCDDSLRVSLIQILAKAAGAHGMIGGQVMDIAWDGCDKDIETIQLMLNYKTGALFKAAFEMGALIANVSDNDRDHLTKIGEHLGLSFQLIDDLTDQDGLFEEETGEALLKRLGEEMTHSLNALTTKSALLESLMAKSLART